ncbi:HTTM domain-containing protein [Fuerstiella marisgermanici]|nr:HTTM domain-containing protein [Fuerstiella marisgermanici]
MEKTYYLNHEYLICLLCFVMAFVPAHRVWSGDSLRPGRHSGSTTPAWTLWLLRFQIAIPYIYAGIAKLDRDWLQGAAVQLGLQERLDVPFIGSWLQHNTAAWSIVYGGLLFDLPIVPCLLWPRTRMAAFAIAALFHTINAVLFDIGVFPWLMIAATTLFLPPDWPRRAMRFGGRNQASDQRPAVEITEPVAAAEKDPNTATVFVLLLFVVVQLLVPFRHHLYPGNPSWTGEGDNFAWRMMLNHKRGGVAFHAVKPGTSQRLPIDVRPMLSRFQYRRLISDPDLILQLAHRLSEGFQKDGFENFEIHAVALVSLNGRRPQLLIDPELDLSQEQRSMFHRPFVLPLTEAVPEQLWNVPVRDWAEDFPELFPAATEDAGSL